MIKNSRVLKLFIASLKELIPGFTDFPESHQFSMADLIWQCDLKKRRHNKLEGYMFIYCRELRDRFGKNGFKTMNDKLNIFEVTGNWSVAKKEGKGYRLSPKVREIRDNYLRTNKVLVDNVIYATKRGAIKTVRKLSRGVSSINAKGKEATTWNDVFVLNKTPVDMDSINNLQAYLESLLNEPNFIGNEYIGDDKEDVEYRITSLLQIKKLSQTDVAGYGCAMIIYFESSSGRLYADGVSLQTAPRIVRNAALNGLYDYDIENCHFSIFHQLSKNHGYHAESIEHYLANKKDVRERISSDIGITIDQAKKCLIMFLYGARANTRNENSIPEEIGVDKAKLLYKHPLVSEIYNDIKNGRKAIIDGWNHTNSAYLINALHKGISRKASVEEKLSHIIQGIETKALKEAVKLYPLDICLLMHDGFVCTREVDLTLISTKIKEATGFDLSIQCQKITYKNPN